MRISYWSSDVCSSDLPVLDLSGAANVETDGSIKFPCIAACRGLRITIHHTDLHAHLIDEDDCAARAADRTGKLAKRLRHEAGLKTDMAVAHLTLDFSPWHQRRD